MADLHNMPPAGGELTPSGLDAATFEATMFNPPDFDHEITPRPPEDIEWVCRSSEQWSKLTFPTEVEPATGPAPVGLPETPAVTLPPLKFSRDQTTVHVTMQGESGSSTIFGYDLQGAIRSVQFIARDPSRPLPESVRQARDVATLGTNVESLHFGYDLGYYQTEATPQQPSQRVYGLLGISLSIHRFGSQSEEKYYQPRDTRRWQPIPSE